MRKLWFVIVTTVLLPVAAEAQAVQSQDRPKLGPAPAWVVPVKPPATLPPVDDSPTRELLNDEQVALEPGRETIYTESLTRIQTPQGLDAGNISISWQPDTDSLTVNKLRIHRGDKVIDVLASSQQFTVLRREKNLDEAMLDGMLTANIQPEGLQVGDVIELATTLSTSNPALKTHVEQFGGDWNDQDYARAHLRIFWPSSMNPRIRQAGALPPVQPVHSGSTTGIELSLDNVTPMIPAKGAPTRYLRGRLVEVSDFQSWAELATLMAPLYQKAATIGADGPLHAELERIRALSPDPKIRAQAALTLVQDHIRYLALAMGVGGLVPADAEATWSRRFGDCKAKTALLLALLHGLGVEADPVLVDSDGGDGMDQRLPMVGLFDHVIVRAQIAGKTYWLDGTRTGDTNLDRIVTPKFGWGLPLLASNAALVRMLPAPFDKPADFTTIRLDASAGIDKPAPAHLETLLRGDDALSANETLSGQDLTARDAALRKYWRDRYDFIDAKTVGASFDAATGEEHLTLDGTARMDWSSGWYETDDTAVGYRADFTRDPRADASAPYKVDFPFFSKTVETILLPAGMVPAIDPGNPEVNATMGGIEYHRHLTTTGNVMVIERSARSVVPEISASEALAAEPQLRALSNKAIYIRKPDDAPKLAATGGVKTVADALQMLAPKTGDDFARRGTAYLGQNKLDDALKDFDQAIALSPRNAWALGNRALVHIAQAHLDLAAKDVEASLALDLRNPAAWRARGMLAMQQGRCVDAVADFTQALSNDSANPMVTGWRAQCEYRAGDATDALRDADATLGRLPQWVDLYLLRANAYRSQGKADAALGQADAVIKAAGSNNYAHVAAANIYAALGHDDQAMQAYSDALAIKPEAYIYLNRAQRRPKADLAGRKADVDAALKLDPKLVDALALRGDMQLEAGELAAALASYAAATAAAPDAAWLLNKRGIAYLRLRDTAHAEQDFAAARARATDAQTLNNLCWDKATAGVALDRALADCTSGLAQSPEAANILDSRAFVLLRLGRTDDAIADYDHALSIAPTLSASLFGRAIAWARKGNKAKSQADLVAALKADPKVRDRFADYGVTLPDS